MFLINLFQYYYLYVKFYVLNIDNDDRISFDEFISSPIIKKKVIDHVNTENAKSMIDEIDTNKGGMIFFDGFV